VVIPVLQAWPACFTGATGCDHVLIWAVFVIFLKEPLAMGEAMSVDGRKKLVNMAMVTKSKGKTSGERTDVQQLREAINANCGTYRVRGRSRWGGVLGYYTKSTQRWWRGRWEELYQFMDWSSGKGAFAFSE
jgi:hypothetical protein